VVYTSETGSEIPESGSRVLIFSNNPEQVFAPYTDVTTSPATSSNPVYHYDFADTNLGNRSLLQVTVGAGNYRDYFEHQNRYSAAINYGVHVYNSGTTDIFVRVIGKGYSPNATAGGNSSGASAISEMMNNILAQTNAGTTPVNVRVLPGRGIWVMRTDFDYGGTRPNATNAYAAGVVDFNIEGDQAIVSNIAYRNSRSLGNWAYPGYSVRTYPSGGGSPESRVYKGLFEYPNQISPTGANIVANLSFTVSDSTTSNSELPVKYKRYANSNGTFVPVGDPVEATAWFTNDAPSRDKTASNTPKAYQVGNDMFHIRMPLVSGSLLIDAFKLSSWPNTTATQPNLGNYGVLYHEAVTVTNTGTRPRTFDMTMNNYNFSSSYAYRDWSKTDNSWTWDWSRTTVTTGNPVPTYNKTATYGRFSVEPGETKTYHAYWMLGAPAGGQIRHAVKVTN
jgi:hypothetical protein